MSFLKVSLLVLTLAAIGCQSKVSGSGAGSAEPAQPSDQSAFSITDRIPVVVSPGATVTLVGTGFAAGMKLVGAALVGDAVAAPADGDIDVKSVTEATFVAPTTGAFGPMALTVQQGSVTQKISIFFDAGKTDHPIMTADAKQVCAGTKYYNGQGVLTKGTKNCSKTDAIDDCKVDGEVGCLTTGAAKAAIVANIANKIVAGKSIAGVAGTAVIPGLCTSDGQISCVTSAAFRAAKMSNFTDSDVRDTVSIAGVNGSLTGAPASCASDGETGCIANANYTAAATVGLADKVLNTETVASVGGTVTLPSAANVYSGITYGIGGNGLTGTLTIPVAGNVLSTAGAYGVGGNGTTPTYSPDFPAVGNVLSSDTVNGAAGTIGNCASPISQSCYATGTYYASTMCATNGADSCVVDNGTTYKAATTASLAAGNIKRGVNVGGTTGNFPSAASPLPRYSDDGATTNTAGANETDLTAFETQVKAAGTFEFWDSSGVRSTGSGDADIVNASVASGINFENLSIVGSAPGTSNCTDAGQIGCTTTSTYRSTKNFRNTARSATATVAFDNITSPSSAGLDVFGDTIDDYHNNLAGLPPDMPWGATFAASSSYWQDLTSDGTCNAAGDNCVYEDKVTGLRWSESSASLNFSAVPAGTWPCGSANCTQTTGNVTSGGGSGAYAANAQLRWWDAIYACDTLTFGGQTDWRLPTQKELMQAEIHGVRSVEGANFFDADLYFWSASSVSGLPDYAWGVTLGDGVTSYLDKTAPRHFACVR